MWTPTNVEVVEDLTVGELSTRSGVAVSALHFYEKKGLITSRRTSGNQRRYRRDTLRRVALVRIGQRVGIPLAEIAAVLATLPDGRTPNRHDWQELSARWQQRLDDRIRDLQHLRNDFGDCIGCGCLSLDRCHLANPADEMGSARPRAAAPDPCRTLTAGTITWDAAPSTTASCAFWHGELRVLHGVSPRPEPQRSCRPPRSRADRPRAPRGAQSRDHRVGGQRRVRHPDPGAHRLDLHRDRPRELRRRCRRGDGLVVPAVHTDSHGTASPTRARVSSVISALPGASWRHAAGQASGATTVAVAARDVPASGAPRVTIRRAVAAPSSRATHSPATTPPAEKPTTSTDGAPAASAASTAVSSTATCADRSPVPSPTSVRTVADRPAASIRPASWSNPARLPP